jgi:hypothetical protein
MRKLHTCFRTVPHFTKVIDMKLKAFREEAVFTEIILIYYYVPTFNNPIVVIISQVRSRTKNLTNTSAYSKVKK